MLVLVEELQREQSNRCAGQLGGTPALQAIERLVIAQTVKNPEEFGKKVTLLA